ncbi:electron-transferring-flavoprotein dehydrogenase [Halomicrobium zhouii]|uniref:Electron-transferring-flavoprotein dehydrogenase n=1 Tax=Halomicrobium zhouii TaxID=767519 RepID=A0A1I6LRW8_9EURY|nr:NAD(P)/FAD-dependent oxidoreductase [Halomicrobium zhouii]SFS06194.1 electron-transferring-flavoprotein dehydrogenase [Halomicrobium zhouii]
MERVDVAIVGGGPGGTSAAHAAARHGADAVVLEKGVPRADRDRLGPDSTDAAGMLDYWVDLMDFESDEEFPEDVILAELNGASFIGPNESVTLRSTGIDASYPNFGFTFHRAKFDDWLRDRAEDAGAEYRVGVSVTGVETDLSNDYSHRVSLADGEDLEAKFLILADGPQRTITAGAVGQFLPGEETLSDRLPSTKANHIAYQEHRRMPEELFPEDTIDFWWGVMPGHTAYPWIFPNDGNVARIGLTMPIGLDIDDYDASEWALLREDDDQIPRGAEYVERLLEREFPDYDLEDFPLVEDRGKTGGTETYPISSTRPIDSPTGADIAVVGGAMGATSAFHEGGDHVAVRTGKIAGTLAAQDQIGRYNDEWKAAIGEEVLRNVAMAEVVHDFGPDDWDRTFETVTRMEHVEGVRWRQALAAGVDGLRLLGRYKWTKRHYRDGAYVQLAESEYSV